MATRSAFRFTSHTTRTRGGVGFYNDMRDNNRLEEMGCNVSRDPQPLPGEMRRWSKRGGQGQRLDLFKVETECACCGKLAPVNIVTICAECSRKELEGETPDTVRAEVEAEMAKFRAEMKIRR